MKSANRSVVLECIHQLEHSLYHLKQANDAEAQSGRTGVEAALRKLKEATLHDVIFASTYAEWDELSVQNIIVGVTAHCQCGHCFCDDVRAGLTPCESVDEAPAPSERSVN